MSDVKIQKIEELLAHQEQQIADLNAIVTKQWDEIDILKKLLVRTRDKVKVLEETMPDQDGKNLSVADIAARDKPPHY